MPKRWRPEELALIHEYTDYETIDAITARLRSLAKSKGWEERSRRAVLTANQNLGYKARPEMDSVTRDNLARLLGISAARANRWSHCYDLPCQPASGKFFAIKLNAFRDWAYKHPQAIAGIESDRLNWIMNDEEFCEKIEKMPRLRAGRTIPVINLETQETFASMSKAAKAANVSRPSIYLSIREGRETNGYRWAYADTNDAIAPARYQRTSNAT